MENYNSLKELIALADKDAVAFFEKGNRTAGIRLRQTLQHVKISATAIRQEISEKKKRK